MGSFFPPKNLLLTFKNRLQHVAQHGLGSGIFTKIIQF